MAKTKKQLGYGTKRLIEEIIKQSFNVDNPAKIKLGLNDILYVIQEMYNEEGKQYVENPDESNRGFNVFKQFAKHLLYRNIANYDTMILLTSEKGAGKSSGAIMLARELCKLMGIRFNPDRHLAYNNKDVMDKIDSLNAFEPLVCDEAVRFACVKGDTIIKTPSGDVQIKNLVNKKNFLVKNFNAKTGKYENSVAEKCVKTKKDVVYEIQTVCGKKISATKEHKFMLTSGEWKELKDLVEGDDIVGQ